jgi:hypothetical protein
MITNHDYDAARSGRFRPAELRRPVCSHSRCRTNETARAMAGADLFRFRGAVWLSGRRDNVARVRFCPSDTIESSGANGGGGRVAGAVPRRRNAPAAASRQPFCAGAPGPRCMVCIRPDAMLRRANSETNRDTLLSIHPTGPTAAVSRIASAASRASQAESSSDATHLPARSGRHKACPHRRPPASWTCETKVGEQVANQAANLSPLPIKLARWPAASDARQRAGKRLSRQQLVFSPH